MAKYASTSDAGYDPSQAAFVAASGTIYQTLDSDGNFDELATREEYYAGEKGFKAAAVAETKRLAELRAAVEAQVDAPLGATEVAVLLSQPPTATVDSVVTALEASAE